MANVSITLSGSLGSKPASCNGGPAGGSGPAFPLSLAASSRSAEQDAYSLTYVLDSPAAFTALPISADQRSRLVYIRALDLAPIIVRLTYETSPPTDIPIAGQGSILLEVPTDDRVVTVSIQGQGRIQWLAAGGIV